MRKRILSVLLAVSLLAVMLLAACSGQNANQSKTVAGKSYQDVSISIVAQFG